MLQLVVVVLLLAARPDADPRAPPSTGAAARRRAGPAAADAAAAGAPALLLLVLVAAPVAHAGGPARCGWTAAGASANYRALAATGAGRRCWCRSTDALANSLRVAVDATWLALGARAARSRWS